MSRSRTTAAIAALILTATGAARAETPRFEVTSGADSGAGSLREALDLAARQGGVIAIRGDFDIEIDTGLAYDGTAPLVLQGRGQAVTAADNVTLLTMTNGADLAVENLDFRGPGGFSLSARGDTEGAAGKGIFVDLRDDQEGTVTLDLAGVRVSGVAGHGIHVSDCSLADECGGGGGGAGEGSPASIAVRLDGVTVDDVGNGSFDADGLRVDERGPGDISLVATASRFRGVGADGVELDEGQEGDVFAALSGVGFSGNGIYCDPAALASFLPDPDEAEFEDGAMAEADIPSAITGSPDDGCFEREVETYASGSVEAYEFGIDLDDGFDIDEAGPGSINATLLGVSITGNLDEGIDFDEEGPGDILFGITGSEARGNTDDGFKMTEADEGGIYGRVDGSRAVGNGGKGFVFEAEDAGGLDVRIAATATGGNDDGDATGIEVLNEGEGAGQLRLANSDIADGSDLDGADIVEE